MNRVQLCCPTTDHSEEFPEAVAGLEGGAREWFTLLKVPLEGAGQGFGRLVLEREQVVAEDDRVLHGYIGTYSGEERSE